MRNHTETETEKLSYTELISGIDSEHFLVLHNDDFNTFDFVINTLVELCGHDTIQAEQCAWFVHLKGKCEVKSGTRDNLIPVCAEMKRRGLTASVS